MKKNTVNFEKEFKMIEDNLKNNETAVIVGENFILGKGKGFNRILVLINALNYEIEKSCMPAKVYYSMITGEHMNREKMIKNFEKSLYSFFKDKAIVNDIINAVKKNLF